MVPMSDDTKDVLVRPVREAARVSGLPRDYLYAAVRNGKIRVIRRGKKALIPMKELERFVEAELDPLGGEVEPPA